MSGSLEDLIDKQISLGYKDPHQFFDLLTRELGDGLSEVARPYLAEFIADMGRQRLNAQRRQAIAKITPKGLADPEVKLRALWVPSDGDITYKRIGDMTAEDFDARAAYLERMMVGISRHAGWCRSVASRMRETNVVTAGELERLPELPDVEDVAA